MEGVRDAYYAIDDLMNEHGGHGVYVRAKKALALTAMESKTAPPEGEAVIQHDNRAQ